MGIFMRLILSLTHFVLLAIDILCFFLIIRMLHTRLNWAWIHTFDGVGGSLVDLYISYLQKTVAHFSSKRFSSVALLNIAMITLVVVRILVVAIFGNLCLK